MAKYIRFTVTPTDGSPYTQWLNTDVVNRTVATDYDTGTGKASCIMGGPSSDIVGAGLAEVSTGNVFAIPTSAEPDVDVSASPQSWWAKALDKMEAQTSQVMFIDADGSPASGIAGLSSTRQDPATP